MDWEIYSVPAVHRQISQWSVSHKNLYITISKQLTLRQEPTLLKSLTSHYIYDKNASVRLLWFHTGHKLCWVKLLWLFNPTVLDLFPLFLYYPHLLLWTCKSHFCNSRKHITLVCHPNSTQTEGRSSSAWTEMDGQLSSTKVQIINARYSIVLENLVFLSSLNLESST